jgi:hypothetical protein
MTISRAYDLLNLLADVEEGIELAKTKPVDAQYLEYLIKWQAIFRNELNSQ